MNRYATVDGTEVVGTVTDEFSRILTPGALSFVRDLAREFETKPPR